MDPKILAFFMLSAALTVTPGVDMALVTRNTLRRGRRAAFVTTLGITSGLPVHAFLSAVGLSLILSQSAVAFEVVKFLGAGYLFYLGTRTFLSAGKADTNAPVAKADISHPDEGLGMEIAGIGPDGGATANTSVVRVSYVRSYTEGLLTNLLNPKVALFYLTFLPQFISPGDAVLAKSLLLAGIHAGLGVLWLTLYSYFVSRLSALLNRPTVKRNVERLTGAILIGFGLRLVWEQR